MVPWGAFSQVMKRLLAFTASWYVHAWVTQSSFSSRPRCVGNRSRLWRICSMAGLLEAIKAGTFGDLRKIEVDDPNFNAPQH
ncbi:hypothetical protein N657DRAFT_649355 [Parathielavia appendiculata]|uniref:Uncharacterized protein n=1 Tax=Parathielavia appendiculata TaxID=2587402 RepID=A0AAN6TUL9_9PEZI|nr:hypothetical protein N657DRAFT_649355 [Parathielavia appendiculata]